MTAERTPMLRATHGRHSPEMNLPEGMTCANCVHFARCNALFGHIATDEVCDWAPSRFHAIAVAAKEDDRSHLERRQDEIDESRATEAAEWEARDRFIEGYDA